MRVDDINDLTLRKSQRFNPSIGPSSQPQASEVLVIGKQHLESVLDYIQGYGHPVIMKQYSRLFQVA